MTKHILGRDCRIDVIDLVQVDVELHVIYGNERGQTTVAGRSRAKNGLDILRHRAPL
jgi:hypothetical protein